MLDSKSFSMRDERETYLAHAVHCNLVSDSGSHGTRFPFETKQKMLASGLVGTWYG